jgi:DNA-binding NtrC family response regulator
LPNRDECSGTTEPADPWSRIDVSGTLGEVSRRVLAQAERRAIARALSATEGDRSRAADVLQIPLRMLNSRIREYKIEG